MTDVLLSKMLRDAIDSQPVDGTGRFTRVCGCVEYDAYGENSISLCAYHGGFQDALEVIAARMAPALELLGNPGDEWPRRALRARTILERIRKECANAE